MTDEQKLLCLIAIDMHKIGCPGGHGCDFNSDLKTFEEWTHGHCTANIVFIELAEKALKLMRENNVSYKKFCKAYFNWKYSKRVSDKMRNLLLKYEIVKEPAGYDPEYDY